MDGNFLFNGVHPRRWHLVAACLLLLVGMALSSCQSEPTSLPPTPHSGTPSPIPTGGKPEQSSTPTMPALADTPTQLQQLPPMSPTPTRVPVWSLTVEDQTIYRLEARLDFETHSLEVLQMIGFRNSSDALLDSVILVVEPNRQEGVFSLVSIQTGEGVPLTGWLLDANFLTIPLSPPLPAGKTMTLALDYRLALSNGAGLLGYTQSNIYLSHWFPYLPPYDLDLGWLAYRPNPVGEHWIKEPAEFSVGIELFHSPVPLVVIAPTLPTSEHPTGYRFDADGYRDFPLFLSTAYTLTETTTTEGVLVRSLSNPSQPQAAQAALETTAQALSLYTQLFGPYPHPALTLIEAEFTDGMEFDGLYYLGREYYDEYDGSAADWLVPLAAHETAHMWWLGAVGSNQAMEPWLDESLATFSELLFFEEYYPDLVPWWWQFRVNRWEAWEAGPVNSTIYQFGDFRAYVDTVYLRGAMLLRDLRREMGSEAFFLALQTYVQGRSGEIASAQDFLGIMQAFTPVDLDQVISTYMEERR